MPRKPKPQAKAVPTGGSYGEAQKLDQAQSAVPLPDASQPATFQTAQDAANQFQPTNVPLSAPTQRPDEPVTHGLPMGPGAGPEVLGPLATDPAMASMVRGAAMLNTMGDNVDPATARLRRLLQANLANQATP